MNKLNFIKMISVLVAMSVGSSCFAASNFKIMTEEYPPFSYTEKGKITGLSTEIVVELASRIGHSTDIKSVPWARGYGLVQKKENMILYSMVRSESRENLFKWVGPLAPLNYVFFAKKGNDIKLDSLEDAKGIGRIGTYKDDAAEIYLKANGFTNIDSVVQDKLNLPKLLSGRIDLWAAGEVQGIQYAKDKGVEDQIEKVLVINETQLYIAFSKSTSDVDISTWQKALDGMKEDGVYDTIVKKYSE